MKIEKHSTTWLAIKEHIEARRGELLSELQGLSLTHDYSQTLRGRLAELKALEALEGTDEKPAGQIEQPDYGI